MTLLDRLGPQDLTCGMQCQTNRPSALADNALQGHSQTLLLLASLLLLRI